MKGKHLYMDKKLTWQESMEGYLQIKGQSKSIEYSKLFDCVIHNSYLEWTEKQNSPHLSQVEITKNYGKKILNDAGNSKRKWNKYTKYLY